MNFQSYSDSDSKISFRNFQLIHQNDKMEFYSPNSKDLKQIYDILKFKLNFSEFDQYFKLSKQIGKGSFSKVRMAESLIDHKLYAVKIISKKELNGQKKGEVF